jgi:hypothetical protein
MVRLVPQERVVQAAAPKKREKSTIVTEAELKVIELRRRRGIQ